MRTRVILGTDPISLSIMAADGAEHAALEANNGEIVEVALVIKAKPEEDLGAPWNQPPIDNAHVKEGCEQFTSCPE